MEKKETPQRNLRRFFVVGREPEKVTFRFAERYASFNFSGTFRFADYMMFIGLGLGLLADYLLGIETRNMYFWLILSVGIGIGMLASFFAEMKLSEKKQTK